MKLVLVRVVLGLIVFSAIAVHQADWFTVGFQVAVSSGFLLLLVGKAGRGRIVVASVLISANLVLGLVGVQYVISGRSLLTPLLARAHNDLSRLDGSNLTGHVVPYSIGGLPEGWWVRDREEAMKDNPATDLWLINLKYDAHIQVIAERLDTDVAPTAVADFVVSNFEKTLEGFTLNGREPLVVNGLEAEVVDVSGRTSGIDLRYRVGCFASGPVAIQVICVSNPRAFSAVEADFDAAIRSLVLEDGVSPGPVGSPEDPFRTADGRNGRRATGPSV